MTAFSCDSDHNNTAALKDFLIAWDGKENIEIKGIDYTLTKTEEAKTKEIKVKVINKFVTSIGYVTRRGETMYTRLLIPLDGSKTAEAVLPYGRILARTLKIPVELLGVIDIGVLATQVSHGSARYFEAIIADSIRSSEEYLKRIAETFPSHEVKCTVEKGKAEEVIIEKAGSDATLTAMATHGRSGINRLLLGSVAEKVLRGSPHPLLLIRANEEAKGEGEAVR